MPNTAPNANPFDLDPPVRPGVDAFNGIAKVNKGGKPVPDPSTMPSAEEWNTICHMLVATGRVVPSAVLRIQNTGAASILRALAAGGNVLPGTFTVTRVSAGYLQVKWPRSGSAALPALNFARVTQYDDVEIDRIRCFPWAGAGAGFEGVEIKTKLGAAATDASVVLEIF